LLGRRVLGLRVLRLRMLLLRLCLLVIGLLRLGMVWFFALLLVLRIGRARDSEKQTKNGCAGKSNYLHRFRLLRLHLRNSTVKEPSLFIGSPPVS
jgi:hypothetical protein